MPPSRTKQPLYYGWVIVAACLMTGTVILGARYSFGVFFKSIEQDFGLGRALTSGIASVNMLVGGVMCLAGGWALDRYGPRKVMVVMGVFTGLSLFLTSIASATWQLFLYYSLMLALGTGPGYTVLSTTASRWFEKKRGLAVATATAGSAIGPALAAPVATLLISQFQWRGAYAVMGIYSGIAIVAMSLLLRRVPLSVTKDANGATIANGQSGLTTHRALRTRSFWLMVASWGLYGMTFSMMLTHLVPHITDIGLSSASAALVLSLIGATSLPSRILIGGASDKMGRKKVAVACALVQAAATVWLIGLSQTWALVIFGIVWGICYGGYDAPTAALIGDVFGVRNLGAIMGGLASAWAFGAGAGPAIGGWIFDVTGSYNAAFLTGAAALLISGLCVIFCRSEASEEVSRG